MSKIQKLSLQKKIEILYFFGKDKMISTITKAPTVLSSELTINKIINDRCSVCRFGDGEFHLMTQSKDLKFQKRSALLSQRFKDILVSKDERLLVCIPKVFTESDLKYRTRESKKFWRDHVANYRIQWYKHLDLKKTYYNSTFTRNYIAVKDKTNIEKYFNSVKRIWENRELLIVEGEYSRIGAGNQLFNNAKSIVRIIAPSENAFFQYENIFNETLKYSKDKLILIALGPTATVLAYDLHKFGYQAIDIGHLDVEFEWFLQKAIVREKIKNKYVIEANSPIKTDDNYLNEEYQKQIVGVVK